MAGLVGHPVFCWAKSWMPGTRPGMTSFCFWLAIDLRLGRDCDVVDQPRLAEIGGGEPRVPGFTGPDSGFKVSGSHGDIIDAEPRRLSLKRPASAAASAPSPCAKTAATSWTVL
jgi:hypothetical protein